MPVGRATGWKNGSVRWPGATYLELLESGGGIMATVRAVRAAAPSELTDQLMQRLNKMLKHGTTTVEIKSGYGLTTEDELKMLRAIHDSATHWPGTICPTACIGHALDPDVNADAFIERTIRETLPAITDEFPGITIDAYCEVGAWDLANTRRLLDAAQEAGHSIRVHADQFNSLGMIDVAISNGYRSVDHLEATDRAALVRLARSETCGVMLPCCGLHLDDRYGCGRAFLDAGGQLAIATNYNPGSAPCFAMPMVIALAVRKLGLTPDEAIRAATCNAAQLLATDEVGIIQAGKRADLVLLGLRDHRDLAFEFGGNPVDSVFVGGQLLQVG